MDTTLQFILLSCGVLAALAYFGTDRLVGSLIEGYSFRSQSMSDICAIGSPKRPLALFLLIVSSIFMITFGYGVWKTSSQEFLIRTVSVLLILHAILGLIASVFFPNRFRERPNFLSMGVFLMMFSVISFNLAIVIGAVAISGWFRIFSITIPIFYFLLTILRLLTARNSSKGSTSLTGIQERTMSYTFYFWVIVFTIYLLSHG